MTVGDGRGDGSSLPGPGGRRPRTNAAEYVPPVLLPRGPRGFPLCRWCKRETDSRRSTFCGQPCVHAWKLRSDPGYLRGVVFHRDRGVCVACGTDTEALRAWIRAHIPCMGGPGGVPYVGTGGVYPIYPRHRDLLRARGYDLARSLWAADHIVPVAAGGGQCDVDNIQTLCVPCHKAKSAREAAARRAARRAPTAAPQDPTPVPREATPTTHAAHTASPAPTPFRVIKPTRTP